MNVGRTPSLIVIDMQNGLCRPDGFLSKIGLSHESSAAVIDPVKRLLEAARTARIPIFFTRYSLNSDYSDAGLLLQMFPAIKDAGGMIRDTWDAAIVDELEPLQNEFVIDKTRHSAFIATDLEAKLRALGVDTLIVCGVTTECCVESTIRDGFQRDMRIFIPKDATAAADDQRHIDALRVIEYAYGTVTTVSELEHALSRFPQAVGH